MIIYVCDECDHAMCRRAYDEKGLSEEERDTPATMPDCCPMDGEKCDWRPTKQVPSDSDKRGNEQ